MNDKYYITRMVDGVYEPEKSIEDDFEGVKFAKCEGLSSYGEIKNIYTESQVEVDGETAWLPNPSDIARESTTIELTLGFGGENRRDVYDQFVEYISGYQVKYHDTARKREVEMILINSVEPDADVLLGGQPYLLVPFKFRNIKGKTTKKQ